MRALVIHGPDSGATRDISRAVGAGMRGWFDVDVADVRGHGPGPGGLPDVLIVGTPPSTGPGLQMWLDALSAIEDGVAAAFDVRPRREAPARSAAGKIGAELRDRGYVLAVPPESFIVRATVEALFDGEYDRAEDWGRAVARSAYALMPRRASRGTLAVRGG